MWIEIFKIGSVPTPWGIFDYTVEHLDIIVSNYSERADNQTAPLVKGHPSMFDCEQPAFGWFDSIKRVGDVLLGSVVDLADVLISDIKAKKFRNISVALTKDFKLVHVAILGSSLPQVAGLKPVSLSSPAEIAICSFNNTLSVISSLNEEIIELEAKLKVFYLKEEEEIVTALFDAKIKTGVLNNEDRHNLIELYKKVRDRDSVEFARVMVDDFMKVLELKNSSSVTDPLNFNNQQVIANYSVEDAAIDQGRVLLDSKCKELLAADSTLSYSDAVNLIVGPKC